MMHIMSEIFTGETCEALSDNSRPAAVNSAVSLFPPLRYPLTPASNNPKGLHCRPLRKEWNHFNE